jgi:hypothetical protein
MQRAGVARCVTCSVPELDQTLFQGWFGFEKGDRDSVGIGWATAFTPEFFDEASRRKVKGTSPDNVETKIET